MSTTQTHRSDAGATARPQKVDMRIEAVVIPVSDVEKAKEFYGRLGWRLDADVMSGDARLVQFTPPGSPCSVQFGSSITTATPGSAKGLYLIVSDVETARAELESGGAEVSEVFHCAAGFTCRFGDVSAVGRASGLAPDRASYASFASLIDPDGNGWLLQEVTQRLPGRVDSDTTFTSVNDLAGALRRAEAAHGEHEKRIGEADANWPDWYAEYMVREQAGEKLPS